MTEKHVRELTIAPALELLDKVGGAVMSAEALQSFNVLIDAAEAQLNEPIPRDPAEFRAYCRRSSSARTPREIKLANRGKLP